MLILLSPFYSFQVSGPAHLMTLDAFKVGFSISVYRIYKSPYRYVQRFVYKVILNPVKLTILYIT